MKNPAELLQYNWAKRLPVILQTETAECGLACLAMIANYYGHKTDLNSLRKKYSISLKGSTLLELTKLADKLQMSSRPLKLELKSLTKLKTPCILHWDMSHFVVLKSVKNKKVTIHDPAVGVRTLSLEETSGYFTGVALELIPTPSFKPENITRKTKFSDFWERIIGVKRILIQLFILSLLLQLFTIASPFYMQLVIDDVVINQNLDYLKVLAFGFGLLALINVITSAFRSFIILYLGTQLSFQMAANLFRHLLKLPISFFEKRHMGDVISRFGSIENVKNLLTTGIIETVVDGIMAAGLLIMMYIYSSSLALVVLAAVTLYIALRLFLYRKLRQLNEEQIVANAKQNSNFMETVRGIQSIKLYGNELQRQSIWQNYYADEVNSDIKVEKFSITYKLINGVIFSLENILVIFLAAHFVIDKVLTIGMLYAFMSYKLQFTERISALVDKFIEFKMLSLHFERLGDIVLSEEEKNRESLSDLSNIQGKITLDNISFSYSKNESEIIENVNYVFPPGCSIAIVGASGSGKTTLIKLILGLLEPTNGSVLLDGRDIKKVGLKKYRSMIGTVMQNDQLLSGSIAENISFFDQNYDHERVVACAKMAAIHNDINSMPMSYQTLIGDMGSTLSGGQKQRLFLARALYKKPKILFLDEATSHLDVALERAVNQTIKELNITRIVAAHRPETISMADYVVEIKSNRLVSVKSYSDV
ncbi:MAG TPA: peptidase domain-containing ABC transporter [Kangiella sp.]